MTLEEQIEILENRLVTNAKLRSQAYDRGDKAAVAALDKDTEETAAEIVRLKTQL